MALVVVHLMSLEGRKKMITGYPFSCTTLCTRVGGVEGGSSLLTACLFCSSSEIIFSRLSLLLLGLDQTFAGGGGEGKRLLEHSSDTER